MKFFFYGCGDLRTQVERESDWSIGANERMCYITQQEIDRGVSLRSADDEILRRLLRSCGGWES